MYILAFIHKYLSSASFVLLHTRRVCQPLMFGTKLARYLRPSLKSIVIVPHKPTVIKNRGQLHVFDGIYITKGICILTPICFFNK